MEKKYILKKSLIFSILLFLFSIFLSLITAEIILRYSNLEFDYLKYNLFYSSADANYYQVSSNARLLYSLKPGASGTSYIELHPLEKKYKKREIFINKFGFRSPEWSAEKPPGVFRIFVFGNSNTYGITVSNQDTYPQQLNGLLQSLAPGKFEVWNGGITASVLSQVVEYARYAAENFSPDLIIIQDFVNFGRRPFLNNSIRTPDLKNSAIPNFFHSNKELYAENIPNLLVENDKLKSFHFYLVQHLAIYRFIHILINNYYVKLNYPHHSHWDCRNDPSYCNWISNKYSFYGDMVNVRELKKFHKDYPMLPIILLDPVSCKFCHSGKHYFWDLPVLSINPVGLGGEYREVHPPSYVYTLYAKQILKYLIDHSYLKNLAMKKRLQNELISSH